MSYVLHIYKVKYFSEIDFFEKYFLKLLQDLKLYISIIQILIINYAKALESISAGSPIAVQYSIKSLCGAKYLRIELRFVIFS